jgi:uncharacterized protein (TIGR00106 family)
MVSDTGQWQEVVVMLAELEIIPIGTQSPSLSSLLAEVAKLIDQSGLDYRVGAMGTVVEGEWDRIMTLAKQCHQAVLGSAARVITTIRIDDRKDKPGSGRITQKVQSLEAKVGRPLRK